MPIPRDQFVKGLDKIRYQIILFLTDHVDQAYQPIEVAKELGDWDKEESTDKGILFNAGMVEVFRGTLDGMTTEGLVDKKVLDNMTWYCIHQD
jgi:hypothetical protein